MEQQVCGEKNASRYVEMINDSMKTNKMIGLIQPKTSKINSIPELHQVGCLGEITNFKDVDGRFLIYNLLYKI